MTGLATYHHFDEETKKSIISYSQDVSATVDLSEAIANDGNSTKRGLKESMLHYAHIPDIVALKMKFEDGVDPFDANNSKKVFDLINTKYKRLKTTTLVHRPKA
jgi:hypothetical protein